MPRDKVLKLKFWCLVNGEETPFSVDADIVWDMDGLKVTHREKISLHKVDTTQTVLWKVRMSY
jgi:hypothetical protein